MIDLNALCGEHFSFLSFLTQINVFCDVLIIMKVTAGIIQKEYI